jgi:hypothetical protein
MDLSERSRFLLPGRVKSRTQSPLHENPFTGERQQCRHTSVAPSASGNWAHFNDAIDVVKTKMNLSPY